MLTSSFPFQAHGSIGQPTAAGPAVEKRLTNERCADPRHAVSRRGGPRQAQSRARRETEIKFTLGLLTSVQCAENVGIKFTQEMQSFRKVCSRCDQKQKMFTQQVKTLRNSLHMNCQSRWKSLHRRCEICKKSLHILSKNDRKIYTEQASVNLCKL